jgi:hypothetical protein
MCLHTSAYAEAASCGWTFCLDHLHTLRQHTSACVCIRQHTRRRVAGGPSTLTTCIRQHTSAYVILSPGVAGGPSTLTTCIRQHTSACVCIRQHTRRRRVPGRLSFYIDQLCRGVCVCVCVRARAHACNSSREQVIVKLLLYFKKNKENSERHH